MFEHGQHARKGCQMRFKATFLAGFAAGFVAGGRAGRERYEQMKKVGRKVAENPTAQKATRAAGGKATELTKVAKDQPAERMPKITETATSSAGEGRGHVSRQPGARGGGPRAGAGGDAL